MNSFKNFLKEWGLFLLILSLLALSRIFFSIFKVQFGAEIESLHTIGLQNLASHLIRSRSSSTWKLIAQFSS